MTEGVRSFFQLNFKMLYICILKSRWKKNFLKKSWHLCGVYFLRAKAATAFSAS